MDSKTSAAIRTAEPPAKAVEPPALGGKVAKESVPAASHLEQQTATVPGVSATWLKAIGPRYLVRIAALIVAVLLWELASTKGFDFYINFDNIPAPSVVGTALIAELTGTEFYLHILHSLERVAIAYVLAVVLGILLGVAMGRSRWAEDIIMPYIELLRPIPAVAWIPLAILMLPTEQSSIIFITFLGALFPVILNTVHGVEQTNGVLVRAARSLGASRTAILWHVILPGAMPSIVAGLAIGMGVAWFSLLAGEIISGQYGIGYYTWNSYTLIQYPQIIIGMLTIGGLGTLCTLLVRKGCNPLLKWQAKGGRS
ncbi:NitT/TauT family transport system permease protein [Marinobacter sp. DSM 26671]|jgi:sulfonate transport system permease protein|uniref:ABC transporter permease n=1 Tax=Marinobacter metalliresistant TaxID=2961995 RepID=A0ABZ2W0W4_9GAMM|nr:ABC transporter permease [Marinobacter sp. DSM 26671]SFF04823.1 NitT/TauT family transport system permease protein [Marinobacter sp. DSM 26671]|tara:strand:+ start:40468 stop:41406 length:939 start_codon:yes stop_codon:yes gene_type:complete